MNKDFFKVRSDKRFLKKYSETFYEFHILKHEEHKLVEAVRVRLDLLTDETRIDGHRMTRLANEYIGLSLEQNEWSSCGYNHHYQQKICNLYSKWLEDTIYANQAAVNNSEYFFSSVLTRLFEIPFWLLERIVGFDIRHERTYREWTSSLVVVCFVLFLLLLLGFTIEQIVELIKATHE